MSHVFPLVDEDELIVYVAGSVENLEYKLTGGLKSDECEDDFTIREEVSARAYELLQLVQYFHLPIHVDTTTKIADLMCNRFNY